MAYLLDVCLYVGEFQVARIEESKCMWFEVSNSQYLLDVCLYVGEFQGARIEVSNSRLCCVLIQHIVYAS